MRLHLQPLLQSLSLFAVVTCFAASSPDDFHGFSNKDGQKIEAKIVSVTPDKKTMKIQRRDGAEFDLAINVLSLDDQMIVKSWLETNPAAAKIDYNLDVTLEKKEKTAASERDTFYKYKTTDVSYQITIRNKSREALINCRVDYVVIMEDSMKIYRTAGGRAETYDTDSTEKVYLRKSVTLPESLAFNYSHTILTEPMKHEQVYGDGNERYGEDVIEGIILRVVGSGGEVIGEYRSAEATVQRVVWDEVKGNAFASVASSSPAESPSTSPPSAATPAPSGELPEWLEINELASWPEVLQKGDTIMTRNMPDWARKSVRITAQVEIDENKTGGVIVAAGGMFKGFSLFVLNDALQFWSRKGDDNNRSSKESVEVPLSEIPAGEFKVAAEYGQSAMKLWINDTLVAEGPSAGLIETRPNEGLSVGYDSEDSSVGPAGAPHPFRGSIRDVVVTFGE